MKTNKLCLLALFFCFSSYSYASTCAASLEESLQSPPRVIPRNIEFKMRSGKKITFDEVLHSYARLMLKVGVNIKEGDNVFLTAHVEHFSSPDGGLSFVEIIAKEAYKMGAKFVHVEPMEMRMGYLRADYGSAEYAGYVSGLSRVKYEHMVESMREGHERWSRMVIGPTPEALGALGRSEVERDTILGEINRSGAVVTKDYFTMISGKEFPWTVVAAPTFEYAQKVFAHTNDSPIVKFYRTWELYIKVLGLDRADPAAYWKNLNKLAINRSQNIKALKAKELRFKSKDGLTDLRVGLMEGVGWLASAEDKTPDGRSLMANIPSVEIFTSPHKYKVNGRMQSSTPVVINGQTVEGLWLVFKEGQVVDYGATKNAQVMEALFKADPNFRYAGEIALVDVKSPVNEAGLTFFNTLFDENRAMHLALGSAYPMNMRHLSQIDREKMGFNSSIFHFDLMFGSENVDVDAVVAGGRVVPVMRNGSFVEAFNQARD